jgi:Fic family protein
MIYSGQYMTYLWERPTWPSFYWTHGDFINLLVEARHNQGRLLALKQSFVHSFEMVDQRKSIFNDWFNHGMDQERLLGWQASLFPTGFAGIKRVKVGAFRTKDLAKFNPPASRISSEVERYLQWWNEAPVDLDPLLRSAISALWFLVLSPFEAGNFTLAAALAEKALIEKENLSFRTYDLALQFEENANAIHELIAKISTGDGNLTEWISFFLELVNVSLSAALNVSEQKDNQENFWKWIAKYDLNQRQRKILLMMFEEKLTMTNRQYVDVCNTSRESAKRDLVELVKMGLLTTGSKKGRSVQYYLNTKET